jgi:hypothetical protein
MLVNKNAENEGTIFPELYSLGEWADQLDCCY